MVNNSNHNYHHILEIDEEKRLLTITRQFQDGTQQLFTSVELPSTTLSEDAESFRNFSQMLGENLLIDSPAARRLLGL